MDEGPTGYMTCEVKGSASCKNKTMENCCHGSGVLSAAPPTLVFLLTLGVRLPWSECPASVAASDPDSEICSTAETRWPPSKGVSSSGPVCIVTVMRVRLLGGVMRNWGVPVRGEKGEEVCIPLSFTYDWIKQMTLQMESSTARRVIAKLIISNEPRFYRSLLVMEVLC
jgi:hypothetical protein